MPFPPEVFFGPLFVLLFVLQHGDFFWSFTIPIVLFIPLWRSLSRAGFAPGWSLLALIPYLWPLTMSGIVGVLAFGQWPAVVGPVERTSWTAFSKSTWIQVTPEESIKNRHYGFDGWLLAFYGVIAASILSNVIFGLSAIYPRVFLESYGLPHEDATVLSDIMKVWGIVLLILMPVKRPFVPRLLVAGCWLCLAFYCVIILGFGSVTPWSFIGFGTNIAFAFLFSWYWLKSKRVNVTYSNRVPAN